MSKYTQIYSTNSDDVHDCELEWVEGCGNQSNMTSVFKSTLPSLGWVYELNFCLLVFISLAHWPKNRPIWCFCIFRLPVKGSEPVHIPKWAILTKYGGVSLPLGTLISGPSALISGVIWQHCLLGGIYRPVPSSLCFKDRIWCQGKGQKAQGRAPTKDLHLTFLEQLQICNDAFLPTYCSFTLRNGPQLSLTYQMQIVC